MTDKPGAGDIPVEYIDENHRLAKPHRRRRKGARTVNIGMTLNVTCEPPDPELVKKIIFELDQGFNHLANAVTLAYKKAGS